ncbi:MAG: DUF3017 domain-containing protein [Actinomycetes bacterium]
MVVLIGAAVALSVLRGFRSAAYMLAGLLALAALARGLLPVRVVGPLAVRSRWVDVATSGAMAIALVVLARGVPE